jgi:putative transposase
VEEVQPHPGRSRRGEGPRHGNFPLLDPGREADLPGPPQTEGEQEGESLADLLLSLAESVPTRGSPLLSYLLAPRELWPLLRSNNLAESFNSLLERRRFGKCHSPWRILQIARAIALNYNLSTCYLILVIILQKPLFLHEMIKYIQ